MSLSIGELVGYIDLDTTGVDRGVGRTNGLLGKIGWGKLALGAGAAAAAAGAALFGIGGMFDDVSDTISVGTGKSGKALDRLTASAEDVGKEIPASFSAIAPVLAEVSSRMGLTGDDLETLTEQFVEAGRLTNQALDVQAITGSFNAFGLSGDQASSAMDTLFKISQKTGVGMNDLATSVASNAANMKQFGFSYEQSANMLGQLDKAGIDGNRTMATLSRAMVTFAKDGKDPQTALRGTIGQLGKLVGSGKDAAAIDLAGKVFGTRGASQFVAAIKSGKLNLDALTSTTKVHGKSILATSKDTADFSESWQLLKNKALLAVEPVAARVFGGISKAMSWLSTDGAPAVDRIGATLRRVFGGSASGDIGANVTKIKDTVAASLAALTALWDRFGADIIEFVRRDFQNIMQLIGGGLDVISGLVKVFTSLFKGDWHGVWEGIKQILRGALNIVLAILKQALNLLSLMWKIAWAAIKALTKAAWAGIKALVVAGAVAAVAAVKGMGNRAKSAASAAWNAVKGAAKSAWNAITAEVRAQVGATVGAVKGLASFPGKVGGYFGQAKSAITQKMGEAVRWLRGIPGKVTSAVGDLGGVLTDAGRALVQGLLDGIEELWGKVTDKLDSLKDKAHDVATLGGLIGKRAAGQSVLFAPLMESIQASENPVRDALKNMAQFIGDAFDKQLTAAGHQVDAKYDQVAAKLRKKLKGKALDKALERNENARDKAQKKAKQGASAAEAALMATSSLIRQQLAQNIADQAANEQLLETYEADLQAAIDLRDEYGKTVSGSARDFAFTFDGGDSAQSYVDTVKQKLADLLAFRTNMAKLAGVLDADTYQDMIDKGVDGAGAMAKALANDPAAAAALADLSKQVNAAADGLGADASTHLYQAGVDSAQKLYDGVASKQAQLVSLAQTLGEQMAEAIEAALAKVGGAGGKPAKPGKPVKGGKGNQNRLPELATGGRVSRPTVAMIGEGREAETVLPDSVLRGLLTRAHDAGRATERAEQTGRTGPLIGQVVQQPGESAGAFAERLWFITQTRPA